MKVMFSKCSEAIATALNEREYGCFYSETNETNQSIHLHDCCEILFCISGGKTFFIDNRIYEVSDGDVFVMNRYERHKIISDGSSEFKRFVLQIHPEFLCENSTSESNLSYCFDVRGENITHRLPMTEDEKKKLIHMFQKLSHEYRFGDDILKKSAVLEIIANVNRYFIEKNTHYTYHTNFKNTPLLIALDYINENYAEPISLEIIAKNSYVSVSTLCNLFKTHMGTTVTKYISSKRMTEAKKLLRSGESVSATAEKCGFSDYATFIRAFHRAIGVPPGKYGKQQEN